MSTELDDPTAENLHTNTINIDLTTKMAPFFDPTHQLAITIEFYFQYAIIAIGVFGMTTNGLVLYALIANHAREMKKKAVNLLLINQNLIDLLACLLLAITFSIKVTNMYLTGALGYFICTIIISDNAISCMLHVSISNLMAITVERYLKVVHPFWSKKHLKRWMIYAAIVFAYVAGILSDTPVVFATTLVENGVCLGFVTWESPEVQLITTVWFIVSFFFVPVMTFVFCYTRIVVVMRRQMQVMAAHNVEGSTQMSASQIQSKRIKWNIIKTMIIVNVCRLIYFLEK